MSALIPCTILSLILYQLVCLVPTFCYNQKCLGVVNIRWSSPYHNHRSPASPSVNIQPNLRHITNLLSLITLPHTEENSIIVQEVITAIFNLLDALFFHRYDFDKFLTHIGQSDGLAPLRRCSS